jgi:hypothetical protein
MRTDSRVSPATSGASKTQNAQNLASHLSFFDRRGRTGSLADGLMTAGEPATRYRKGKFALNRERRPKIAALAVRREGSSLTRHGDDG